MINNISNAYELHFAARDLLNKERSISFAKPRNEIYKCKFILMTGNGNSDAPAYAVLPSEILETTFPRVKRLRTKHKKAVL